MEETIKDRFILFLKYLGIGQGKFEKLTDIGNGTINNIKDGISSPKLAKILNTYPELNIEWLITGKGNMLLPETLNGVVTENNIDYKEGYLTALKKIKEKDNIIKTLLDTMKSENALHKDLEDMGLSSIPEKERKKYEAKIEELNREIGKLQERLNKDSLAHIKGGDNPNVESKTELAEEKTPASRK